MYTARRGSFKARSGITSKKKKIYFVKLLDLLILKFNCLKIIYLLYVPDSFDSFEFYTAIFHAL